MNPAGATQTPILLAYLAASILFILGLKMLSNPARARAGNLVAAAGMVVAILATFFLLNEASTGGVEAGRSNPAFPVRHDLHRIDVPEVPEAAVAHDEAFVLGLYARFGLKLERPPAYGTWSSGQAPTAYCGYQDLVVARR